MTNYQRYQPRRSSYRSSGRQWSVVGWSAAGLIVIVLAWNGLAGPKKDDGSSKKNRNVEITLAGTNDNVNTNTDTTPPVVNGRELTAKDCSQAISVASTDSPFVALTLDAGGSIAGDAKNLVNVLKQQNIPATLFATGPWAEQQAEIVKAYSDAGFDVFNRGYGTTSYATLTKDQIDTDLTKAETAIVDVTSETTKPYFRPPLGDVNDAAAAELKRQGYCPIVWTVDAQDTKDGMAVVDSVSRVSKALKRGAIILMHANSDIALELVPALATEIKDRGYTLVSLRDLLRVTATSTSLNTNSTTNVNRSTNTNKSVTNTNRSTTNTNKSTNTNKTTNTNKSTNTNKN
jgi:peptidoglycan/xylan/chitin deacetylase (PgdA/CDA1 family)